MLRPEKQALLSLGVVGVIHGMIHTFSIFLSPLNAEISAYFRAESISAITAFKTTYLVVYAASNLVFGALTNRLSARLALSLGMIFNSLAFLAFLFVPSDGLLAMHFLWLLAAVGGGVYHPVANAFITRLYPDRKGWALGITGMGAAAGFAFGPLLTGLLSGAAGLAWSEISFLFGLFGTAVGAAAYLTVRDVALPPAPEPKAGSGPAEAKGGGFSVGLWIFLVFIVAVAGTREIPMWSILDVSDFFLEKVFSGKANTAWYLFLLYLSGVLVQPLAGTWSDRIGRSRLAALSLGLYGLSVAALAFTPAHLLFIPYFLMGIGQSASIPTIEALVADFATPRTRGLMFGFFITALTAVGALGPLLSGLYLDANGRTSEAFRQWMLLLGGVAVLGALAMAGSVRLIRAVGIENIREIRKCER